MKIIFNADDFGMSESVNRAIVESFKKEYVSNTTIVVNMPFTEQAVELSKQNGFLDRVGLHLNLSVGEPLTESFAQNPILTDKDGNMSGVCHTELIKRLYIDQKTFHDVQMEAEAQIQKYLSFQFSQMHCDSHHHMHVSYSIYAAIKPILERYGFKSLRLAKYMPSKDRYLRRDLRLYKSLINHSIKKSFQSHSDVYLAFEECMELEDNILDRWPVIESSCHPIYQNGVLINKDSIGFSDVKNYLSGKEVISYCDL